MSANAIANDKSDLDIHGIRYGLSGKGVRVVFDLSKKTDYRVFYLDKPYRVVVDVPKANWKSPVSGFISNKIIKSYRSGEIDKGLTRVIFDIKQPALVNKVFNLPKDGFNKDRLVIDLEATDRNTFVARKGEIHGNKAISAGMYTKTAKKVTADNYTYASIKKAQVDKAASVPQQVPKRKPFKLHTVVIDAGHGGEDPGAVEGHTIEKDITLSVAKELRRQMEKTGRYKIIMTRDKDFYVKLRERLNISREVDADLFISIHADKIDRKGVRGTSIYTLSETSSDSETARLAKSENNSGFIAGVDLGQESQDVADILLDLAMREKMNESNMFARILKNALIKDKVRMLPNSHRSAGFAVLKAPDVPSILIETGFISNKQEAKLLKSPKFHRKLAKSILKGTDAYFRKIKSLQSF